MNQDEVVVEVKEKMELEEGPPAPPLKSGLSEDRDYVDDYSWPELQDCGLYFFFSKIA